MNGLRGAHAIELQLEMADEAIAQLVALFD
jgi:hypothetical protein